MKVEVISSHRVRPLAGNAGQQSAILPAIDSWYAHWRTIVPIYLFSSYNGEDAPSELLRSFSQTINMFPQLAGTLAPCVVDGAVDREGRPLRRLRLDWAGDNAGAGAEFIAAKTKARIQSLVPPRASNASDFLWDRSEESSLRPLFPQAAPKASGIRVQVTLFRCGGFSLAVDCDHAMADAYTVVLFMRHWGAAHAQLMFTPAGPVKPCATAELPKIIFDPEFVLKKLPKMDDKDHDGRDLRALLLQQARQLPARRPDLRNLSSKLEEELGTSGTTTTPSHLPEAVSLPPTPSVSVPYMLHLSGSGYERVTRRVQKEAIARNMSQVTDQVAIVAFVWAALNRARLAHQASAAPCTELHLPTSFRWKLGLPPGLLGSPLVAVMVDGGGPDPTDAVALAAEILRTLDRFDEQALLAVTYDASLRSTPEVGANRGERRERMDFTSGVATGAGATSFGRGMKPVFFGLMALPVDDLFLMTEAMPARGQEAPAVPGETLQSLSTKWYKDGVNIFFSTSRDVFDALAADPAFGDLELVQK